MDPEHPETVDTQGDSTSEDGAIVGQPRMRIDHLTPPAGTCHFSRQTITFFNDQPIGWGTQVGRLTWKAEVHTYVTGAHPDDPDFSQKGLIYIVMVHYGFAKMYLFPGHPIRYYWKQLRFELWLKTSGLSPTLQLPSTGSETEDEEKYHYEINFGQRMQMFRNNGNETFTFDASYQEKFTRLNSKQTGSKAGQIQFTVDSTPLSQFNSDAPEIYGLSMLMHNNPSAFPLSLSGVFTFKGDEAADGWSDVSNFTIGLGI